MKLATATATTTTTDTCSLLASASDNRPPRLARSSAEAARQAAHAMLSCDASGYGTSSPPASRQLTTTVLLSVLASNLVHKFI